MIKMEDEPGLIETTRNKEDHRFLQQRIFPELDRDHRGTQGLDFGEQILAIF